LILESKSFSNSFDRTGSKLIDLYDSASSAGLSGFWIIIICAIFYWGGKKPHLSTALHSWIIYFIAVADSICSTLLIMRSYFDAFFRFRYFIVASTSLRVKIGIACATEMVLSE